MNAASRHPSPIDHEVGVRIRRRRVSLRMSQTQLANAVGVSFQQIQKYENGSNRISASRLFVLAKSLGMPISHFFEGLEPLIPSNDRDE